MGFLLYWTTLILEAVSVPHIPAAESVPLASVPFQGVRGNLRYQYSQPVPFYCSESGHLGGSLDRIYIACFSIFKNILLMGYI